MYFLDSQSGRVRSIWTDHLGLRRYDVLTSIDGTQITDKVDYLNVLDKHKIGDAVELEILSNGAERKVSAQLQDRRPY